MAGAAAWAEEAPLPLLTLAEARARALEGNPLLAMEQAAWQAAQARWDQARAAFGPGLLAGGEVMATDNPLAAFGALLKQGGLEEDMDFNRPGQVEHANAHVEGRYRIYDGGGREGRAEAAKAAMRAARWRLAERRQGIVLLVEQAYRQAQVAEAWVEVAAKRKESTEASLALMQERAEAGSAQPIDLMRVKLADSEARDGEEEARMQRRVSRLLLREVMGRREGDFRLESLEGAGALGSVSKEGYPFQSDELAAWREAQAAVEAAEQELRATRAKRGPVVDAYARGDYDDSLDFDSGGGSWTAGARAEIDIWRNGALDAEAAAARAELRRREERLRQVDLSLKFEYDRAVERLQRSRERLAVREESLALAREWERLGRLRWEEGVYTTADYLDAQQRYYRAEAERLAALAEVLVAQTGLRKASGQLQVGEEAKED